MEVIRNSYVTQMVISIPLILIHFNPYSGQESGVDVIRNSHETDGDICALDSHTSFIDTKVKKMV